MTTFTKEIFISIVILILLLSSSMTFAHREWVHQYIVGEGFRFLKNEYNIGAVQKISQVDLDDFKNKI